MHNMNLTCARNLDSATIPVGPKKVVREMFLDNVHFKEPIYKRLNMQLLHFLQEIAAGRGQYLSKED